MDSKEHNRAGGEVLSIDREGLIARCLGNLDLVERVLACFEDRFTEDLAELESACRQGERSRVQEIAHRMKGACANAGAPMLMSVSEDVEQLAGEATLTDVSRRLAGMRREWERFCQANKPLSRSDSRN